MTLKPIKAHKDALGAKALERAIKNALNAAAKGAQVDFKVTTRTWTNKPEFEIDDSQPDRRVIKTDDKIYGFVDQGTRPHIIRPHGRVLTWIGTKYKAKTIPGVIKSQQSRNDNTVVYTKLVQHPGTKARNFAKVIRDKWAPLLRMRVQSALLEALQKRQGTGVDS